MGEEKRVDLPPIPDEINDCAMVVFDTIEDAIVDSPGPWESVILENSRDAKWRVQIFIAGVRYWGLVQEDPVGTCHWFENDKRTRFEEQNLLKIAGVAG